MATPDELQATTMAALLDARASDRPAATCLMDGERVLTFQGLRDRVGTATTVLNEMGIQRGDAVALWLPSSLEWVEIQFALARLGAAAVSINARFKLPEVERIVRRTRSVALILDSDYLGAELPLEQVRAALTAHGMRLVDCSRQRARTEPGTPRAAALSYHQLMDSVGGPTEADQGDPDLVCTMFCSSGTTAEPKIITHTQATVTSHAVAVGAALGYAAPDCVVLDMLPLCGVFGFNTFMAALAAGAPVLLIKTFSPGEILDLIKRHRTTHTHGTDDMYRRLFGEARSRGWETCGGLRYGGFASFGGDPEALVRTGADLGVTLHGLYGSSEVQALAAFRLPSDPLRERARAGGYPVSPQMQVRARHLDSREICAAGEIGELEFTGPSLMAGYFDDPVTTESAMTADGYFRSKDLGFVETDGSFEYFSRLGDVLRLSGFLTTPREIESVIEEHPDVAAAQVITVASGDRDLLVAFVVPSRPSGCSEDDVTSHCRASMAHYKVPKHVFSIAAFPVTNSANGEKVQKERLRAMAIERLGRTEQVVPEHTSTVTGETR